MPVSPSSFPASRETINCVMGVDFGDTLVQGIQPHRQKLNLGIDWCIWVFLTNSDHNQIVAGSIWVLPLQSARAKANSNRLLVYSKDNWFKEILGTRLVDSGYHVVELMGGQTQSDSVRADGMADLIVLDNRLPKTEKIDVLKRLHNINSNTQLIILTLLRDKVYQKEAVNRDAMDSIEPLQVILDILRPISSDDQCLRTCEAARKISTQDTTVIHDNSLRLYIGLRRVFWNEQQIALTVSEFKIICSLVANTGSDVSYRQIYDLVRGKDFVAGYGKIGFRTNVRAFIKRIRKKFRQIDPQFRQIGNCYGYGYYWKHSSDGAICHHAVGTVDDRSRMAE